MVALLWVVGFVFVIAECVLGVLFNFYIIILNAAGWRRGLPLSLCDKILVLMAINNICLQCDMNTCTFLFIMYPNMLRYPNIFSTVSVFVIFQMYFSFWITAILCVYYCLRIVSFKLRFFIHLKANITSVVTRFLIGSGLGSLAISLMSIWEIHLRMFVIARNVTSSPMIFDANIELSAITQNLGSGSWIIDATMELTETYKFLTIALGCCLPFVLAILSIVLTLTSLWTHYYNMKYNRSGFCIPSLDAHKRAARIMVYLSILYAIFYLSEVSLLASSVTIQTTSELAALFFLLIYPTIQSSIVILGNSKLCPTYLMSLSLGKNV